MFFSEFLQSISAETYVNLNEAVDSGGCAIRFDNTVDINFEHHENSVYLFSPVMRTTGFIADDFFASLLQIHLFGIATQRCWFGFDAAEQQVILFSVVDLDTLSVDAAVKSIETIIEQVTFWRENLQKIAMKKQPNYEHQKFEHNIKRQVR